MTTAAKQAIALVTGATGALGTAFCERLIAQGMTVVATGRNERLLAELALRLPGLHTVACDLTVTDDIERLLVLWPHVDFLVAAAGIADVAAFEDRLWHDIQHEITLNAVTVARLLYHYGAGMLKQGHGQILTVASTACGRPSAYFASYAASKSFVISLSKSLTAEWGNRGVWVCCCIPGPIKSGFSEKSGLGKRSGGLNPQQVAEAALRACSLRQTIISPCFSSWLRWTIYRLTPDSILSRLISRTRRYSGNKR